MTQRIFDIENEKDMQDLWKILPDEAIKARKIKASIEFLDKDNEPYLYIHSGDGGASIIKINWHDKTEITRPIQEATEEDIGKMCYFEDEVDGVATYGILSAILQGRGVKYKAEFNQSFRHARRLTKQEIEELC